MVHLGRDGGHYLPISTDMTVSWPLTLSAVNLILSLGLTACSIAGSLALNTIVIASISRLGMAACLIVNLPADSSTFVTSPVTTEQRVDSDESGEPDPCHALYFILAVNEKGAIGAADQYGRQLLLGCEPLMAPPSLKGRKIRLSGLAGRLVRQAAN